LSYYNEKVNELWDEWIDLTGRESGDPDEFVEWAMANRRLGIGPQDVKQLMRRRVSQALRQARRYDEVGRFAYRSKQSVTLFEGDAVIKHYFDTDRGGTPTLRQKSMRQRREGIAHDAYRALCDAEHMNRIFPDEPELKFWPDFTDDMGELRTAELLEQDRDDDEDAA
jgi:hypothetical protein